MLLESYSKKISFKLLINITWMVTGNMNVLSISYDTALLSDLEGKSGNSLKRMILQSQYTDHLHICVLAPRKEKRTEKKISDKLTIYGIPCIGAIPSLINAYFKCSDICRTNKIDVITTQDPFFSGIIGILLKRKYKKPLNIQIHGDYLDNRWWIRQNFINYIWNSIAKKILLNADSIRPVNEKIGKKLIDYGISPKRIFIFPIFIDFSDYCSDNFSSAFEKKDEMKNKILFVGSIIKRKGIDILLYAISEVIKHFQILSFILLGKVQKETIWKKSL